MKRRPYLDTRDIWRDDLSIFVRYINIGANIIILIIIVTTYFNSPMARNTVNPRFFKDGCWNKEHSPANLMIFVDIRVSTNFGVSNKINLFENLGQNFIYKIYHLYQATIGSRSRDSPHFNGSDGQKYGKSKNFSKIIARNRKEHSLANSTIIVDLYISTNFGVSNRENLGLISSIKFYL